MNRPIGVIVIAVLSLLGSVLTLVMGILIVAAALFALTPSQSELPLRPALFKALLALCSLMYILPAIWGIVSGIGLLRMRNWARISTIVFSVLLILMGGFTFLTFLLVPVFPAAAGAAGSADPAIISAMRIGMACFWIGLAGTGVGWLVYLTRARVRQQFVLPPGVLTAAPPSSVSPIQQYQSQTATIAQSKPERPLSFTILAWFLLISCLFLPLSLALHAPAVFLTRILTGWPAMLYNVVVAAVLLYVGIGLLLLKPLARSVAIGYFVFAFVNSAVFFLAPGRHTRLRYFLDQQQARIPSLAILPNQFRPQIDLVPMMIFGGGMRLILVAVILYFLITRKQAFEMATRAR